jgi:hypothetical protein
MKVWVTRDKTEPSHDSICRWADEPIMSNNGWFHGGTMLETYEIPEFKKDFGFTPRKGTCKQCELSLKEIK